MNFKIFGVNDLDEKEKEKVDNFILDESTNGEFINTIKYLSYHPKDRFHNDSLIVKDNSSGAIKCVMMAASTQSECDTITSHPGTTFAGMIFNRKTNVSEVEEIVDLIESHYKLNYKKIVLKTLPMLYSLQPNQEIDYTLMKRGYKYGYTALANIIDLSRIKEESEIFKLYKSKRRNQVKRPIKKENFDFIKLETVKEDIWSNMNSNMNDKFDSNTTHSYLEIMDLVARFPKNIIPYVAYRNDEEYGAFALIYKFKNVFHTQYLDMNYKLSGEYPNLYLIHNLIKVAISEGYRYFSFGASTENGGEYLNEGLFNYKNEFGGGSILLPKYIKEF